MTDNNKPNDQAHEYDVLADDYDLDEKEIYELVRKGMSMESIAGLAGLSLKQFEERLHLYPKYQARFRRALALFELDNIKALEESAGHQDAPLALKNKNARENLKTKEHWATASKPVSYFSRLRESDSNWTMNSPCGVAPLAR